MLAARRSCCVGVRNAACRAGKSVNTITQEAVTPTATQMPISRMGRMSDTASAAKPAAVANIEAVQGTNLLHSANTWCAATGRASGRSTKRECR